MRILETTSSNRTTSNLISKKKERKIIKISVVVVVVAEVEAGVVVVDVRVFASNEMVLATLNYYVTIHSLAADNIQKPDLQSYFQRLYKLRFDKEVFYCNIKFKLNFYISFPLLIIKCHHIITPSNLFNLHFNHLNANSGITLFGVNSNLNFNGYIKKGIQLEFKLRSDNGANFNEVAVTNGIAVV